MTFFRGLWIIGFFSFFTTHDLQNVTKLLTPQPAVVLDRTSQDENKLTACSAKHLKRMPFNLKDPFGNAKKQAEAQWGIQIHELASAPHTGLSK